MKTLKIAIASYDDMKARTMAIARGDLKPKPGDPKVWFTSTESFAKVLSNKNRALLATIAATHPDPNGVNGGSGDPLQAWTPAPQAAARTPQP
jgi:predicted transcriptional regulator